MESLTSTSLLQNAALINSELRGLSPICTYAYARKTSPIKHHLLWLGGLKRCVVVSSNQSETSPAAPGCDGDGGSSSTCMGCGKGNSNCSTVHLLGFHRKDISFSPKLPSKLVLK